MVERVTRRPRRALLSITWNATRCLLTVLVLLTSIQLSILVHDPLPLLRMHTFLSNSQVTLTCFLCPSQPTRRYADIYVRCGVSLRAPFGCEKKKRRQAIEKKKKKRNIKYLCSLRFFFYKYNIIYRNAELVMTSIYK